MTRDSGRANGDFNPCGLAEWLSDFTRVDWLSCHKLVNSGSGKEYAFVEPLNISWGAAHAFETELNKKETKND